MNTKNIIGIINYLKEMEAKTSPCEVDSAIIAYNLFQEEYPAEHGLTDKQVATLADLLGQISTSSLDDPRFSSYDYGDAVVHTAYDVDPERLIDLGAKDFSQFAELMAELAAQKRAVYEGRDYNDETLLALIKETKVGSVTE